MIDYDTAYAAAFAALERIAGKLGAAPVAAEFFACDNAHALVVRRLNRAAAFRAA
jgi:hypothetical protein